MLTDEVRALILRKEVKALSSQLSRVIDEVVLDDDLLMSLKLEDLQHLKRDLQETVRSFGSRR